MDKKKSSVQWISPEDRIPEFGKLIVVKWDERAQVDYDCWVYSKDEEADWGRAICWLELPLPEQRI